MLPKLNAKGAEKDMLTDQSRLSKALGNHSKWVGAAVGSALSFAVTRFGLPAALATPEVQFAVSTLLVAGVTWMFPKNVPRNR